MIVNYACDAVMEHKHEITSLKNAIYKMIYTILKTGEYIPPDLDYIADKMRVLVKSELQLLSIIDEDREIARRKMKQEVRSNIESVINKEN